MAYNFMNHGVRPRYLDARLDQLAPEYGDVLEYFADAPRYVTNGKGMILSGPPGVGKTHAMAALGMELKRAYHFDFVIKFAPAVFDWIYSAPDDDAWDDYRDRPAVVTAQTVEVLILTNLGQENKQPGFKTAQLEYKVNRLLRERFENRLPVFITTNLPLDPRKEDSVAAFYGEGIWSMLLDMTQYRTQLNLSRRCE